jgi:hypothetical protein
MPGVDDEAALARLSAYATWSVNCAIEGGRDELVTAIADAYLQDVLELWDARRDGSP